MVKDIALSVGAAVLIAATFALWRWGISRVASARVRALLGPRSRREDDERRALLGSLATKVERTRWGARLKQHVVRMHPAISFSDALALALASMIAGAISGHLILGGPFTLFAALGAPVVADRVGIRIGGRRLQKIEAALPEALAVQSAALKAGQSTTVSLRTVAESSKGPLAEELRMTVRDIEFGRPFQEALEGLASRTLSRDVELWVDAMLVHRVAGGNLAKVIHSLSNNVRERIALRAEVRALTAQGRMSGGVVAAAPLGFFIILSMTSRDQMRVLFTTPLGLALLAVGLSMEALGFLWIRSILRVSER